MEPVKSVQQGGIKKKSPDRTKRYPADFKLQIVKKYLEESIPVSVIRQECGVSSETCEGVKSELASMLVFMLDCPHVSTVAD